MKKLFLLAFIMIMGCHKKQVQEEAINRKSIDKELAKMLVDNDSLRIKDYIKNIKSHTISTDEKKALEDCVSLHHFVNSYNYEAIDSLSWNHIDFLYKNSYEEVGLFYACQKFYAELYNKSIDNFLPRIDSCLVMFSKHKSNCLYGKLLHLKITYLMVKSYYNLALNEMQKTLKDNEIITYCPDIRYAIYMEMSFLYSFLKLSDKSLESGNKALSFSKGNSDKATAYSLIARAYLNLKSPKKALEYINKSLAIVDKGDFHMINYYNSILLEISVELGNYNQVDLLFKEYQSSNGYLMYHQYLFCKGKAMSLQKQKLYAESLFYFLKAKTFLSSERVITERKILKDLSDIYVLNGDLKQALHYLNEYQKNEELFTKQQNENLISEQTVALKVAEKEAELLKAKKKALNQELIIERKNKTITIAVVATSSILLITMVILYFNSLYKKKNKLLHTKNQVISEKIDVIEDQKIKLFQSLKDRELLLKEIHHRVKNNLQLVISMMSIQSRRENYSNIEEFIETSRKRILAMIGVHQTLYEQETISDIDVETYINKLVVELASTFEAGNRIKLTINTNAIYFSLPTTIVLGLIVNETISNAFKHAFNNRTEGNIIINLEKKDHQKYQLIIEDDGIGFDLAKQEKKSFGLDLISLLVKQLNGKLEVNSVNGTKYIIEFQSIN